MHRYAWCRPLVEGKTVLDIACGEGYGSALLAGRAVKVIGVDIASEAVEHARQAYRDVSNLEFMQGDAAVIPLPDASVDVVVSFETIEHHDRHEEMISEIRRVLRPNGLLIISSPNREVYSEQAGYHNEFHVKELDFGEFDHVLRGQFDNVRYYGQRLAVGSVLFELQPEIETATVSALTDLGTDIVERTTQLIDPVYFVAIATPAGIALPQVPSSILFSEAEDLYIHHREIASWAQRLNVEHEDAHKHIAVLTQDKQAAQEETEAVRREAERNIEILRGELTEARRELIEARGELIDARGELIEARGELMEARGEIVKREASIHQLEYARDELTMIKASHSWRLTRPLRFLARVIRRGLGA
jgi:SAM-dependent methyltransferase